MSTTPQKDFGPIADDYAFFEHHATEAEQDARAYAERLAAGVPPEGAIRMLDFGCGSGTFTARLLQLVRWPPARLRLTLVEPVESARRQAVERLAGFTEAPAAESADLPAELIGRFDVVLANHVLYYVPDLQNQLARLIGALSASGLFLTAIAARTNTLIQFSISAFSLLGEEIPYHTSEGVDIALRALAADYQKHQVTYELTFPDAEENRLRVIRFLLGDHLTRMPRQPLLDWFDPHSHAGRISIRTACDHFTIQKTN